MNGNGRVRIDQRPTLSPALAVVCPPRCAAVVAAAAMVDVAVARRPVSLRATHGWTLACFVVGFDPTYGTQELGACEHWVSGGGHSGTTASSSTNRAAAIAATDAIVAGHSGPPFDSQAWNPNATVTRTIAAHT